MLCTIMCLRLRRPTLVLGSLKEVAHLDFSACMQRAPVEYVNFALRTRVEIPSLWEI